MYQVRNSENKLITVSNVSAANKYDDFFCPSEGCSCIYHYRAYESNRKKAHFFKLPSSSHSSDCTVPHVENMQDRMEHYDSEGSSVTDIYSSIMTPPRSASNMKKATHSKTQPPKNDSPVKIRTIRQLYSVCILNDINDMVGKQRIRDFFVGQKTSFLYTKYCNGLALVEARFRNYQDSDNTLVFTYPFRLKKEDPFSFRLTVHIPDGRLYKTKRDELYDLYYKQKVIHPVLIFSEWQYNNCDITVSKLIIPL